MPITATDFPLRLRLHYKTACVDGVNDVAVRVEEVNDGLQEFAGRVFSVAECLRGETVFHEGSGWYKCGTPILVWFYLVGPGRVYEVSNVT